MLNKNVIVFCIYGNYLKSIDYKDDKHAMISTNEILTIAIVISSGNRGFFSVYKYILRMVALIVCKCGV